MTRSYLFVFKCKPVIKGKLLHHWVHSVYLFIRPHDAMSSNWRDWVHYSRAVLDVFFFTSDIKEIAYSSEWLRGIFHNIHADNIHEVFWEGFLCHISSLCPVIVKLYLYIQNLTCVNLLTVRPPSLVSDKRSCYLFLIWRLMNKTVASVITVFTQSPRDSPIDFIKLTAFPFPTPSLPSPPPLLCPYMPGIYARLLKLCW